MCWQQVVGGASSDFGRAFAGAHLPAGFAAVDNDGRSLRGIL